MENFLIAARARYFAKFWSRCHVYEWLQTGFRLVIGFTEHLPVVTTSKHNNLAGLHTLNITVTAANTKSSAFTSRLLLTDLNTVLRLRPYCLAHTCIPQMN
jgi:hypothetical protein